MQNFLGHDGFSWWMGVVESRDDPLNLGRCRVRIFGLHTENIQDIPTETLSWAHAGWSPNSSWTSSAPLVGDYVFGFFTDGASHQAPVLLAVFPGIPKNGANPSKGFSEGDHYPLNEPTTSRLYRNENIANTIIGVHNSNLDTAVPTASGGTWDEPKSQYATKPPYNNVTETLSGHVIELDDTPGAERIHVAHIANTFFEIAPDGSKVTKVSGKNYEIYLNDNNIHVKGMCNITVDGDANLYVKGNMIEKVDGDVTSTVGGNVTSTVGGAVNLSVSSTFTGKASSFNLTGDVNVQGKITASGDVIGGGISLDNHVHGGVRSGPSTTSGPQ